jgi:N-acyl-D-amino-acid deacylase
LIRKLKNDLQGERDRLIERIHIMKKLIGIFSLLAVALLAAHPVWTQDYDYDYLIRGGELYLGGFEMAGAGDVAVKGDRIVVIGNASGSARRVIDAGGLIVSPGFIDLHTHCDFIFYFTRGLPMPGSVRANMNYITQGVTTVITGNCGSGYTGYTDVKYWLDRIDKMPFGTNVIHLIPHGQLRLDVMGEAQADRADPRPTPEEMQKMKGTLEDGLKAGAWGMSTGLEYDPGARADIEELVELNRVVAGYGGVYASHIRHEGPEPENLIAAIREAIEIGERAGNHVQISHIKCSGRQVHGMSMEVIKVIEEARARGVDVTADQYPYTAGSTTLSYLVPVEKRDGTKVIDKYCTPEGRKDLYDDVAHTMATEIPADGALVSLYPWKPSYQGKTIAEIAQAKGEDPVKVGVDLACSRIGTGIYFIISENDMKTFMQQDWVATGSDGSTFLNLLRYAHPRFYGAFPKKIRRFVFEQKIITLPFALRSMTELPADAFNIPERGKLEEGYFADIVVFDPENIRDIATYDDPCQYSQGIEYLFVNGVLSIDKGEYTGRRGGRALRLGR